MRIPGVPYIQGRNSYPDRDGRKYGVAIHCTANTASARDEAGYATRRTDGVSGHLYADDREVIQSLDTAARAGHAGSDEGNDHAVAVEITGLVTWSRSRWLTSVAWDRLGAALAAVVRHYGVAVRRATVAQMRAEPRVRAFYDHNQMRQAWGGTTHTDPGPNFPWDRLFSAIHTALGEDDDMALTDDDLGRIAEAVWAEGLPNPLRDYAPQPARAFVGWTDAHHQATREHVDARVAELSAAVRELLDRPAATVDHDVLADAIVARLPATGLTADAVKAVVVDVLRNGVDANPTG